MMLTGILNGLKYRYNGKWISMGAWIDNDAIRGLFNPP